MRYRVVEKMNPLKSDSPVLFYPVPVYTDTLELKDLLPEISNASSVTSGDVKAVVESFVELLQRYLVRGNKIKIDGIGTFRLSFKGKGKESSKDVNVNDIENPKVTYLSDKALKDYVAVNVKFVKTVSSQESDETVIVNDEDNNFSK